MVHEVFLGVAHTGKLMMFAVDKAGLMSALVLCETYFYSFFTFFSRLIRLEGIKTNLKKGLLIVSFFGVSAIELVYGVFPEWFFETFLVESHPPSVDQLHILRAVMMLYMAFGLFWLWSAFSESYRDAGVLVLCVFCGGLAAGRILSVVVDGIPSPLLILYIFVELSLFPVCIWFLRRPS